jgi:serine/arginine repetitive matrix protein 2
MLNVRDFFFFVLDAKSILFAFVTELKELRDTYQMLVSQVQHIINSQEPPRPRAMSPTFFHLPRPHSRNRSYTNPLPQPLSPAKQLATAFYTINSKYRVPWECADLLIELGGGSNASPVMTSSVSAPAVQQSSAPLDLRNHRGRAITLTGDESKVFQGTSQSAPEPSPPIANPSPNLAWRASTGRHDLSHRQLVLLREILNHPESATIEDLGIPEEETVLVDRQWRWGGAMGSTVTLPSGEDESAQDGSGGDPKKKKRRGSRMGMRGLRDMLRGLKKNSTEPVPLVHPVRDSQVSLSTESSSLESQQGRHHYPHPQIPPGRTQYRKAKTSVGPESIRCDRGVSPSPLPCNPQSLGNPHKSSPRRPSIASIFRIGQKSKPAAEQPADPGSHAQMTGSELSTTEDDDWDRMDSASDLEAAVKALGGGTDASTSSTVKGRGKSPYLQNGGPITPSKKGPNASQSSIWGDSPQAAPHQMSRLSNVEESVDGHPPPNAKPKTRVSPSSTRKGKKGVIPKSASVRSAPPMADPRSLPDPKLAMTPENIKPLLENSREVQARLVKCIGEVRTLLAARS